MDRAALVQGLLVVALGLSFSGLIGAAFELLTARRASFRLLQEGRARALAAVPLLVAAGPFIILRNSLRGLRIQGRPFGLVALGAALATIWGLMVGRLVFDLAVAVVAG